MTSGSLPSPEGPPCGCMGVRPCSVVQWCACCPPLPEVRPATRGARDTLYNNLTCDMLTTLCFAGTLVCWGDGGARGGRGAPGAGEAGE